ncbi:Hypothetical protein Cp262_1950 [Corynebacterium pseudotuberculosis]|nr:Hypothetical protein Cp262_1950 [Corynebacterium pseudotuberculosis]
MASLFEDLYIMHHDGSECTGSQKNATMWGQSVVKRAPT